MIAQNADGTLVVTLLTPGLGTPKFPDPVRKDRVTVVFTDSRRGIVWLTGRQHGNGGGAVLVARAS